jgi:DNA primase
MPRISEEVIKEVLQKTDIVDVVSEKVSLSKKGKTQR